MFVEEIYGSLQRLKEATSAEAPTAPPPVQRIERQHTLEKEHKKALERAVTLNIPHAVPTDTDEELSVHKEDDSGRGVTETAFLIEDASTSTSHSTDARTNWNDVVEKLFAQDETGKLTLNKEASCSTE